MAKRYSTWHGGEKGERMRVEGVNREGTGENEDVGRGCAEWVGRRQEIVASLLFSHVVKTTTIYS